MLINIGLINNNIKHMLGLISTILIIIYPINLSYTTENPDSENEAYYKILQPGIHPSAPLGHPNYKPMENNTINNPVNLTAAQTPYNPESSTATSTKDDSYYKMVREEAFNRLLNTKIPLTPEQIIELNKKLDRNQQAIRTSPVTPPKPISSTIHIDLSPGSQPPIVRLATGFVSSLVFVDATGQPWPVADYSLGNPQEVNIQWDKKTNALFVQSTAPYVTANLAVRLVKLDTPIMISLVTGQKQVDYRLDFQVHAQGPNALPPIAEAHSPTFGMSPYLLKVLDGIPPENSKELKVSNNIGRAWLYNNKMIFRTTLMVLSPAWNATVASADGTKVYEFIPTPLILAAKDGKTVKIEITGF